MRRALDTNVLVRLLIVDDTDQSQRAVAFVASGGVEVQTTVILETEWVLRSVFRLDRRTVCDLLLSLLGLQNIRVIERDWVASALALHREGMDFADALRLLGADGQDEFGTFDRALAKSAQCLALGISVRLL